MSEQLEILAWLLVTCGRNSQMIVGKIGFPLLFKASFLISYTSLYELYAVNFVNWPVCHIKTTPAALTILSLFQEGSDDLHEPVPLFIMRHVAGLSKLYPLDLIDEFKLWVDTFVSGLVVATVDK